MINLFGMTGDSWNDSISAAECVNLVPEISNDKGHIILRKRSGHSPYLSNGSADFEFIEIYGVNTSLDYINGDFTNRLYFVFHGTPSTKWLGYWLGVAYYNGTNEIAKYDLIELIGATGNFSNFTHNATKHGGKVMIGDRGSNKVWIVTMNNNPALDAAAIYTMPTGWKVQYLDYQDGFFLANIKDGSANEEQRKVVSSDFGVTTFNSANYYERTADAGNILRIMSDKREVWVFCDDSIEILYNTGSSGFSFLRNPSVFIDNGIIAPDSLAKADNQLFFIGYNPNGGAAIYKTEGYAIVDITPTGLLSALSGGGYGYQFVIKAMGNVIKYGNDYKYVVNFPSDFGCWEYSLKTGLWNKHSSAAAFGNSAYVGRGTSYVTTITGNTPFPHYVMIQFKSFVGSSWVGSKFLHAVSTSYSDLGHLSDSQLNIFCIAVSRHIFGENDNWVLHRRLQLEFAPEDNMAVTLYYSDNDGATWTSVGTITASNGKYRWNRLGKSRDRLYKFLTSSNTDVALINSWLIADGAAA